MKEEFIHFVWRFQYFKRPLVGSANQSIQVIRQGLLNQNSGPDFTDAEIRVDGITWAGHVEIHLKSSDWYVHGHHNDPSYDGTILHVVWENDREVRLGDGSTVPTVQLKNKIDPKTYDNYRALVRSRSKIPCATSLPVVDKLIRTSTLDKVGMERLYKKSTEVLALVQSEKGDWETVAYRLLVRNFGFKVNALPFEQLARSVPLRSIRRADNLTQIEALIFGQAGFLEEEVSVDDYYFDLQRTYRYLRHKFQLEVLLNRKNWKFLRMRPSNFPTMRMAQLSKLLEGKPHLFSWMLKTDDYRQIIDGLRVQPSDYWTTHYHFGKLNRGKAAALGENSAVRLIMNTVVPLLVAYGQFTDDQVLIDRACDFLDRMRAEPNRITRLWQSYEWVPQNAFDSQAMIELYNSYCVSARCTCCNIGAHLIQGKA